ncbi:MAG: TraB/GumN family protein [Lentisphaeria bacterium]|nr:TraB/GumN family protein [Lentisphaeria bacterium]
MRKLFSILWLLILLSNLTFADKNYAWKVSKGDKTLYMLGSIHAMKKSDYPLNQKLMDAFSKSDNLVVEIDTSKMNKATMGLIMKESTYSGDQKLSTLISKAYFTKICKKFAEFGYSPEKLEKMKPWWLMMLAAQFDLTKLGLNPKYGIDHFFSEAARKKKMRILEIEGMQKQLKMFFELSNKYPQEFIHFMLQGNDNQKEVFNQLVGFWKKGDLAGMEKFFDKIMLDPKAKVITDAIIIERNIEMTNKIVSYIQSRRTHFVIVGAGHFVGETGFVKALRKKGYTVEQLEK